jgi:hypothetical protein
MQIADLCRRVFSRRGYATLGLSFSIGLLVEGNLFLEGKFAFDFGASFPADIAARW